MSRLPLKPPPQAIPVRDDQMRLQLQGLQHQVAKSAAPVRRLVLLALLLLLLFTGIIAYWYLHYVFQFAALSEITIGQSRDKVGAAEITFMPSQAGKIEFIRKTQDQTETVTEYAVLGSTPEQSKNTFTWAGDGKAAYSITAWYRRGIWLVSKNWSPELDQLR